MRKERIEKVNQSQGSTDGELGGEEGGLLGGELGGILLVIEGLDDLPP